MAANDSGYLHPAEAYRGKILAIRRLFEKSATKAVILFGLRVAALMRKDSIGWGLPGWRPIFEAFIVLLIVFMPVIHSWKLLLPLLLLLWLCSSGRGNFAAKELGLFWIVLAINACLAVGLKSQFPYLLDWGYYLGIAYIAGKVFTTRFGLKICSFICYSSLLWILLGLAQQWVGIPTPPGWLDREQGSLITVRIYSVFSNPNIYALYLINILIFTCYFLCGRSYRAADWSKLHFWPLLWLAPVLVSLYFTYSRFAWFMAITFLVFWFWPGLGKRRWLILLIATLFLLTLHGFKIRTATLLNLSDNSMRYRIRIWQGSLKAISKYWLWGIGCGNFQLVYPWYQVKETVSVHTHQLFLQLWLENGIASLMAFLWLMKKLVLGFLNARPFTKLMTTQIIVFLVYGLVETWSQNHLINGYFWLFGGLLLSSKSEELMKE
jgi:Lipid A core - O-antigen ligase and related enzymes